MRTAQSIRNIDEFISLAEVARLLKLSRRTVREHLLRDGVPAYVLSEKRNASVRYRRGDVDRWLEQCRLREKIIE